mgnify:FL=1
MKASKNMKIALVSSNFWKEISDNLEKNCLRTLVAKGVLRRNIARFRVPGALEIPLLAKRLAAKGEYDALIAFGAIHKGETYHFEQVANECIRGCMNVSFEFEIPVIYEVLAVYDMKHAWERTTRKKENRGVEAALSALQMVKTLSRV